MLMAQLACDGPTGPLAFEVTPPSLDLIKGDTAQLSVVVHDANGTLVTGRSITYESRNPAVVTVSTSGLATAVGSGTTTIALSAENVSGSVPVTVSPACGSGGSLKVEVTPDSLYLIAGETSQLAAVVRDTNGQLHADQTVSYLSEDVHVATVSTTGLVTAVTGGSTTILASAGAVCSVVPVTVIPTVTGSWTGSVGVAGGLAVLRMTVTEVLSGDQEGEVSGTGSSSGQAGTLPMTITGTRTDVSVTLVLSISGFPSTQFDGVFAGNNKIDGHLNGSGFTGTPITFERELGAPANMQADDPGRPQRRPGSRELVELLSAEVQRRRAAPHYGAVDPTR